MRILVVKLTSLGDVIHTLPAVTDASKRIAGIEVHWLVEENFKLIPAWHPAVSKIFTAATRRWRKQPNKFLGEASGLRKQLKSQSYDLIIDAQGLLKSSVLAKCANGTRVGYDKKSIKESLASRFYDKSFAVNKNDHAVTRTRSLFAQALDYQIPADLDYGIPETKFQQTAESNYLVFLHGTTWSSKQWPTQSWQKLVSIAHDNNYEVKLLWGNDSEYNRASEIAYGHENATVSPKMNLNEVANMISNASGVVAVDTGLGHLAAALSVPCVNLYGATDSARTGTIGKNQAHLQAQFECSPCLQKICSHNAVTGFKPACFEQFSPVLVWRELEQLIKVN